MKRPGVFLLGLVFVILVVAFSFSSKPPKNPVSLSLLGFTNTPTGSLMAVFQVENKHSGEVHFLVGNPEVLIDREWKQTSQQNDGSYWSLKAHEIDQISSVVPPEASNRIWRASVQCTRNWSRLERLINLGLGLVKVSPDVDIRTAHSAELLPVKFGGKPARSQQLP